MSRGIKHCSIWGPGLLWVTSAFVAAGQPGQGGQASPSSSPQRTILDNRVIRNAPGDRNQAPDFQPQAASGRAIESILDSTENLNSIRDGYLRRLAGDGCAPDVAMRVADLRARLHDDGSRANAVPATARQQQSQADLEGSLRLLAAKWYDAPPATSAAPVIAARDAERARSLEMVLSPKEPPASVATDSTQMKAELDRLLASCRAGR